MVEAVRLIGERHAGERVAGVTHAVIDPARAGTLLDLTGSSWRIPVGRGSLTKFEVEDGEIRLVGHAGRRRCRLSTPSGPRPRITSATA